MKKIIPKFLSQSCFTRYGIQMAQIGAAVGTIWRSKTDAIAQTQIPHPSQQMIEELRCCLNDWAQLNVYHQANQTLAPPKAQENRIIFFGDSITEFWNLATTFPNRRYINRGIAGQTTPQMLVRFRPDVIALKPKVVLILAGTNDLAGNTGPMTLEMIEANYTSIAELAQVNNIRLIFASVLPVHDYSKTSQSKEHPPTKIRLLNDWLKQYCALHHHTYLDYYNHLVDNQGMLKAELSDDGLHPNANGYRVMAPLAEAAIQTALQQAES